MTGSAPLILDKLTVKRGQNTVVDGASLSAGSGEFIGLIGPNGAGKTTLLRAALGLIPASGRASLAALPAAKRAQLAAWMPQGRDAVWSMPVEALVALGRIPHFDEGRPSGRARIEAAIARLGLGPLRHRPVTELSGGELTRVLLARMLAQDTPLLLADEPIAGLDPAHQIGAMQLFRSLADEGRCVIASLHDLGLAVRHCTRLILLDQGRIVADGAPEAVLSAQNLARSFGISGHFAQTGDGPIFQPLRVLGGERA